MLRAICVGKTGAVSYAETTTESALDGVTVPRSSAARPIEAVRGRRGYRLRDASCDEIEILLWAHRQLQGLRSRSRGHGY